MRVGEVAERAGVNVETLRYYERRGLLPAPERTPSGHRRYDEETVRFLGAIKEAQAVGFTLAEIAEYLRAARRSGGPSEALRVRMAAKIDQIDGRIAALRRMRDELARVVGCACVSLDHCTCGAACLARRGGAPTARPWAAFQAPEPTILAEWAARETAQLPFVASALRRLLEEVPAPADGHSGTERRALQAVAAGARTPPAAFVAAQRLEEAPFIGDAWFYRALSALGQGETRLLETEAGTPLPRPPPLGDSQPFARLQLRLTATGEQTLRGEADRVELLGIDRWIGGTHITPDNTWRWDAAERKLVG